MNNSLHYSTLHQRLTNDDGKEDGTKLYLWHGLHVCPYRGLSTVVKRLLRSIANVFLVAEFAQ